MNPFPRGDWRWSCAFKNDSPSTATTDSSTKTSQVSKQIGVDGGSLVATEGSTIEATIESADAEVTKAAIEGANKTAEKAISGNTDVASASISAASKAQKDTLDFTDKTIERVGESFKAAQSGSTAQLQDTVRKITGYGLLAGTVVALAWAFKKPAK